MDTILPETDSPSASQVGVDQTIDTIVGNVYSEEAQQDYQQKFSSLSEYLTNENFSNANEDGKLAILKKLEQSNEEARQAFFNIKEQTISYYLTSEEIGEKFLNYLPVQGAYEPCIDLASVGGKIWSL